MHAATSGGPSPTIPVRTGRGPRARPRAGDPERAGGHGARCSRRRAARRGRRPGPCGARGGDRARAAGARGRAVERSWTLTRALARAGAEELWDRPDEAAWTQWLRYLVAATSDALLACAESVDGAGTAIAAVHREHFATPDEQQAAAAAALVATCLQTLALFDERSGDRKIA
jgi:hypothetical protein